MVVRFAAELLRSQHVLTAAVLIPNMRSSNVDCNRESSLGHLQRSPSRENSEPAFKSERKLHAQASANDCRPLSSAALRTIGCTPAGKVFHFAKRQEGSQLSLQREQTSDNVKLFS